MQQKIVENKLADLTVFIFSIIILILFLEYTPYMFFHILTGETLGLEKLKKSLNKEADIFLILTLFLTLILMDKKRYKVSKLVYFGTYPYRMNKKYKFVNMLLSAFIVLVSVEMVYVSFYLKYWGSDKIVKTTEIKKKCCYKKVDINGSTYYCFKEKN